VYIFQYEKPYDISVHTALFECPLVFNCEHNALLFSVNLLAENMPSSDLNLQQHLLQHTGSLFTKLPISPDFWPSFNSSGPQKLDSY
jgi:hypothetical protein